jgi:hypothetical protein
VAQPVLLYPLLARLACHRARRGRTPFEVVIWRADPEPPCSL